MLRRAENLINIDYEQWLNSGRVDKEDAKKIVFRDQGYVYGPIRLSSATVSPVAQAIQSSAGEDFLRNRKAIFMPRDPRDIIVSAYLSFTGAHEDSKVDHIARKQRENRKRLEQMSIDEFALDRVGPTLQRFRRMHKLIQACGNPVMISYEEMINNFPIFSEKLSTHLDFSPKVLDQIFQQTRPRECEDMTSHKRSGRVGAYTEKLKPETVKMLNAKLEEVLPLFGYR